MGRYLVTGGAGFIGSHMARALIGRGDQVVIVDNLSTGLRRNLPPEAEFVAADLVDPKSLDLLPGGSYDGVVHFAAQSSGAIGQMNPHGDVLANVGSTVALSRWCLKHQVPKMLFASSMLAYGHNAANVPNEACQPTPVSYYGASKVASEEYLRLASLEGLSTTTFRIYNAYGPGQNLGNKLQGMVSIYMAYMLEGQTVPVTGSLERYRDFVYIDDIIAAFMLALDRPSTPSAIYNLGTGQAHTVRRVLQGLIAALRLPADYPIEELPGSPHDAFGSKADIARITAELGWAPKIELEEGLRRMADWALSLKA